GAFNFTVRVTDANSVTATAPLSIVSRPVITSISPLAYGIVNEVYAGDLTVSGATAPATWSITAGALPAGITMSSAGHLSGTPTAAGSPSFTAQVGSGAGVTATRALTLPVFAARPTIVSGGTLAGG